MDDRNSNTGGDRSATRKNIEQTKQKSFVDTHGNTVSMSREQVRDYAAVRSEYLGTILNLLNEAAHGDSDLPEKDRGVLHCLATDLAHDVDALLGLLTEELNESKGDKKGGA